MRVLEHPSFNLMEFAERWRRARVSAIQSAIAASDESLALDAPVGVLPGESELLLKLDSKGRELALKNVFDFSRKLGLSAARFLKLTLEIDDFAELLPYLNLPCFRAPWLQHNSARVSTRSGCEVPSQLEGFGCDYWREALDGLIMGMGENERLSRHRSVGHGDSECVDVLFTESAELPRMVSSESAEPRRYGPIPPEMQAGIDAIRKKFEEMKIRVHLDGLSEGVLYYRLEPEEGVLCGAGGTLMQGNFSRDVQREFPSIIARDASPLAVYGGST